MLNRVSLLASVVLAVLVVILATQNFQLKKQLAENQTPAGALVPGERLGPIQLIDPTGDSRALAFSPSDRRTVLLFFTPTCPACRATIPVWRQLIESTETSVRILGVNLSGPGASQVEGLITAGWPFPVFGVEPEKSEGLHGITYVPATVILDESGVVLKVWFGELDSEHQAELTRELRGG